MKNNYFKLLLLEEELKKKGQSLPQNKLDELIKYKGQFPQDLTDEFIAYQYHLMDHFNWKRKKNFIQVMRDFLESKITLDEYIDQFLQIEKQIEEERKKVISDFEILKTFEPDERSFGFANSILNLRSDIRLLEEDDSVRTPSEVSPKELISGIRQFLPRMEEY